MARPLTQVQLLAITARLPQDRFFTCYEARELGVSDEQLRRLADDGLLDRRLKGVYCFPGVADTLENRIACLALVLPADCVLTDITAAWIWCGERALPPNSHRVLPRLNAFAPPGRRLRNGMVDSGERALTDEDVVDVAGVLVTTPLRTACDLARLLHADSAFAAMDALAALDVFTVEELVDELDRFKGYRGIIQARQWAPWVDPGSDSWLESVGRKRWVEGGLPRPQTQCPVPSPTGEWYLVDFGLPDEQFGCEVFGEEFHGEEHEARDRSRLAWLRDARAWLIVVARNVHITGREQNLHRTLRDVWTKYREDR